MSNAVLHTYLCERLQSAKGLGWALPDSELPGREQVVTASIPSLGPSTMRPCTTPPVTQQPMRFVPRILRFWRRFAA